MTIDQLAALHAARKDEPDLPRTMSPREIEDYLTETRTLIQRLSAARTATDTLSEVAPALTADNTWLQHLTTWREILVNELLEIKSPIRGPGVKDRYDSLTWSIRVIDFGLGISTIGKIIKICSRLGELMEAAGYETEAPALDGPNGWRGAVHEVKTRIAELTKRQTDAQALLAEALLDDTARATRDAERAKLRETLNTMRVVSNSTGTGVVALTPDGDILNEADMTPAQRTAFEWFAAAAS